MTSDVEVKSSISATCDHVTPGGRSFQFTVWTLDLSLPAPEQTLLSLFVSTINF